jgi:tripartite-type tricarboxylate transporter receptor subunit TctC
MKKILMTVLSLVLSVGVLAGCSSSSNSNNANETSETTSTDVSSYPEGPITVIIPYSPGGGSDILTRTIMKYIQLPNDEKLVAVNVEGASGFTGAMQAFNTKNDGYTILAHNPMDVVSYSLSGTTDIELWSEFENVCGIVDDFNVVVTNPQSGWKTIDEAVEYIKAHPGEVKVGNTGNNNGNMADCLRTLDALGIKDDVTVVPYDGGSENKTALMGNHIQLSVNSCADIQTAITSGDHVALLTIGDRRAEFLPDTPCTAELKYDVVTTKPRGWYAPKGMDSAQIAVLQEAIKEVCENEEFQKEILSLGLEVNYVPGDELKEKISTWVTDLKPVFEEMQK